MNLQGAAGEGLPSSRPPALVLGSQITALGVIRALGAAGVRVYRVSADPGCERWSRFGHRLGGGKSNFAEKDDLPGYLSRLPFDRAVLVPCSDGWNAAVDDLPADLKERFPCSLPSAEAQAALIDKGHLARTLSECEIPHPVTAPLDGPDSLQAFSDQTFEDAILKPRDSQAFFSHYGVKAFRTRSRDDAVRHLAHIRRDGHEVVLQQFVAGPPSNHIFLDGFVDRHGKLRGLLARRRLRMYPADFGNSSAHVTIPISEVEPCRDMMMRLFERIQYRGLFSTEFKLDDRDGIYKVLEVNTRAWWYIEFSDRCGLPLAYMAYRDALGEDIETVMDYRTGVREFYPYFDYHSCRDLWRQGKMSLSEWARAWLAARQSVFNWSDPMPTVAGLCCGVRNSLFRRTRRRRWKSDAV